MPVGLVTLVPDDAADLPTVYAIPPQSQGNQGGLQMVVRGRDLHDVTTHIFSRTDTIEHAIQTLQREGVLQIDRPIFLEEAGLEQQQTQPKVVAPAGYSIADSVADYQRLSDDFTMQFGRPSGDPAATDEPRYLSESKDFNVDPVDTCRLSEEFMDLSGLDGFEVPVNAPRSSSGGLLPHRTDMDQQALAALNAHNRVRRTSSETVMAMLSDNNTAGAAQGEHGGTMALDRSSSEALMSFLVE